MRVPATLAACTGRVAPEPLDIPRAPGGVPQPAAAAGLAHAAPQRADEAAVPRAASGAADALDADDENVDDGDDVDDDADIEDDEDGGDELVAAGVPVDGQGHHPFAGDAGRPPLAEVIDIGLGDLLGEVMEWQERALCAQTDPEAFFPEKGGSTREAKRICSGCEVRAECLEYALAKDERFGIWGGMSERERRKQRRRAV
ncbi:WhiB family transcriptional regulator [Pseudofrankia sp. BMG5.37]|uniref:WhiB family transcriptional regulator n=2 Tax=unclassified Pseudofrankia TaxID=2994372 RepID=UPI002379B99A|nr:WhiB family transcriptional regulator [Pseudofrankia sp. BMG5.36]MDT3439032.1 WhiB family transcriptional regulator [Pseudofrankia sp. BMG5.37]